MARRRKSVKGTIKREKEMESIAGMLPKASRSIMKPRGRLRKGGAGPASRTRNRPLLGIL